MSNICYIVGASFPQKYCRKAEDTKGQFLPENGEGTALGKNDTWKRQETDFWIAADAGYEFLKCVGLEPDLVVGDFDSLEKIPRHVPVVTHPPEKDETDMYLAYEEGRKAGYDTFIILGGTGGRPDHTYANYQQLLRMRKDGARGYLYGDGWCSTVVWNETLLLKAEMFPKGTVSVFCLEQQATGVTLTGLKYPLLDVTLQEHIPLGVSNEFCGIDSGITVKQGALLVMWEVGQEAVEKIEQGSEGMALLRGIQWNIVT